VAHKDLVMKCPLISFFLENNFKKYFLFFYLDIYVMEDQIVQMNMMKILQYAQLVKIKLFFLILINLKQFVDQ
jgi:hypothetical protein